MQLTGLEKRIIHELQKDLPVEKSPFATIAAKLGIREEELITHIKRFVDAGIIRRFGATIYHHRSGFEANVMVAWKVPENKLDEIGGKMANFSEVTHCYARITYPNWPYNLYTMIHGRNKEECLEVVRRISEATGIKIYRLLFTENTFKRTSPEYF